MRAVYEACDAARMEFEFITRSGRKPVRAVRDLAEELLGAWSTPGVAREITRVHVHRAGSDAVSAVLAPAVRARGFTSERKGLFAGYDVPGLRPDWYLPLGGGDGVIVEVERGGVLTNNRDLLDFYKCHICREANHLFLLAPRAVHGRGSAAVVKRMRALFAAGVDANVESVAVFGYGDPAAKAA
jgi:hypothetical protein